MRLKEILNELGLVVPGVNSTCDVGPGEIARQAAKFGNVVDANGLPPVWTGAASKTGAKDTPNKDASGKQTFYGKDGTPPRKSNPVVEGLIEGPIVDRRVLPRMEDGSTPQFLYRIMSAPEYAAGMETGVFLGRPTLHASDKPALQFAEPGDQNVLVKIAYHDDDGWRAKHSGMGVVAITDGVPAERVQMVSKGTRDNLTENRLPLPKGGLEGARGSYAAMMCVMHPMDFLRLTTTNQEELQQVLDSATVSLADFKSKADPDFNKDRYNIPFLRVVYPSGLVMTHEGRHRAARVLKAGGDKFPCVIYFRTPTDYLLTYEKQQWTGEEFAEGVPVKERFPSASEAYAREEELEELNRVQDHEFYYSYMKIKSMGGLVMKGSPRSNPENWSYDAWQASDMPAQLIGQFNQRLSIPTSTMRFGPVKGYRHYRSRAQDV